jgi:hypothetical protein
MTPVLFYNSLLFAIGLGFLFVLVLCGLILAVVVRRGALNARVTANTTIMPAVRAERQVRIAERKRAYLERRMRW